MTDSAPHSDVPRTALVMSGGGARGAYQVGVLRAVVRRWPAFQPSVITGVSAGAINAVVLAARPGSFGEAVGGLSRLWGGLTTEDVFRSDAPSLTRIAGLWTRRIFSGGKGGRRTRGMLDTDPLRRLLRRALDPNGDGVEGISANVRAGRLSAFGITATDYATGRSVTWVEGHDGGGWDLPKRRSIRTRIGVEHVMASAALPLVFPAVRVGPAWYGDGGIRQTAPLSPALHLGAARLLAVSTRYARTAREAAVPATDAYPPPAQIVGVLMNAVFLDSLDQDATTLRRISELTERLPVGQREGLRPVDLLILRPSEDLGRLAADYEPTLPRPFRFLMRGLGTRETRSPDWLSMLLFEPAYLERLMAIGERDAEARLDEIGGFLGLADR